MDYKIVLPTVCVCSFFLLFLSHLSFVYLTRLLFCYHNKNIKLPSKIRIHICILEIINRLLLLRFSCVLCNFLLMYFALKQVKPVSCVTSLYCIITYHYSHSDFIFCLQRPRGQLVLSLNFGIFKFVCDTHMWLVVLEHVTKETYICWVCVFIQ